MFRTLVAQVSQTLAARVPSQCRVCRAWPARTLCDTCVGRFAQPVPRCRTCALPVPAGVVRCGACLTAPPPLDQCLAAVGYAWPWSTCVAAFKFGGQPGLAPALAMLMRSAPWAEPALEQADALLPMPLSPERLAERGYNQSALLARAIAPDKFDAGLLLRIRHTAPQSALDRADRLRNVRGAFAAEPLRAPWLAGRRVLLVDDVMTSGASLHAAALALRQAGAAEVGALVFARTEPS